MKERLQQREIPSLSAFWSAYLDGSGEPMKSCSRVECVLREIELKFKNCKGTYVSDVSMVLPQGSNNTTIYLKHVSQARDVMYRQRLEVNFRIMYY